MQILSKVRHGFTKSFSSDQQPPEVDVTAVISTPGGFNYWQQAKLSRLHEKNGKVTGFVDFINSIEESVKDDA